MNRQASILFNIDSSIRDTWLALQEKTASHSYYQRLIYRLLSRSIYTTEGFQTVGRQLAGIARHAQLVRQMEVVKQASQMMLALPVSNELKAVADYYQAICVKQRGDFAGARGLLERVVEEAPPPYRAQALHIIGATYYEQGEVDAALPFYLAAGKAALGCDLLTLTGSQAMIAVVRSIHGDHKQALNDLEQLFPLARVIGKQYPALYYDVLNSLAVELGEVGRLNEAKAACAITLASPFSAAYPNWAETSAELEAKRTAATPSVVAVSRAPEPVPVPQAQAKGRAKPVGMLAFRELTGEKSVIQITLAIAPAISATESAQRTLDRVRFSIQPRGPPCRC